MSGASTARKILGGIAIILALFVTIVSTWLLIHSINDPNCRNFNRELIWDPELQEYNYNQERNWNWKVDGLGRGRGHGREYVEGRNVDDYCLNFVDNWKIASAIGLGLGVIQLILSICFFLSGLGENPILTAAKGWTITWMFGQIFVFLACGVSLFFSISGEAFRYYMQINNVGFLLVGSTGIDGIVSVILAIIAYSFVLKKLWKDERRERARRAPKSRAEIIRAQKYQEAKQSDI